MFKENFLEGKVIVVTGGGTGLGKSMAMRFAELGAHIVVASRKMEVVEEAKKEFEKVGPRALAIPCDVRNANDVKRLKEETLEAFDHIDVLVNNAAGNFICPTENLTENGFRTVVDIVLHGTFLCTHEIGQQMIQQKKGSILNIVTTYAWTGSGYVIPSACAKAGVLAMTRSLAVEWGRYGLRLNAIAPGPFPTEGAFSRLVPPGVEKKMKSRIPYKRFGDHSELANLATFLVGDGADFINGEVVTIDGGEWLKGAGQFNELDALPKLAWKAMSALRKK